MTATWNRKVLVPKPGERWRPMLSALVETTTAVAVDSPTLPTAGNLARLQGKLRSAESTLVVDTTGQVPARRSQ
ncbi:hypothetical protein ACPPVW_18150 [Leifsonia sp. McL0607]|uniref:hypothetical protein n=1 Tax=Leifsonia sp. McL0607 TaxID=3415672 RepID=UPI003CEE24E2